MVFYQFSYWEIFLKQFGDLVLTGNNSFYFTTDLITSNYNFVTKNCGAGSNIL